MELVRNEPNFFRFLICAFLVMMQTAPLCVAQYPSDSGFGNTPMGQTAPVMPYQPAVPSAPAQTPNSSRPSSWPGSASPTPPAQVPGENLPPLHELNVCEGARELAHVGSEVILECDVAGPVNDFIEANKDRIPPNQIEATREFLIRKQLKNQIQNKLIFLDAKHTIPSEGWPQIEKQLDKAFEESEPGRPSELEKLMKRTNSRTRAELDAKLRMIGTSLEHEKRSFGERELTRQWVHQQIKRDDEITYDQMVVYYRQNLKEFTTPARAKWEELMVRTLKYPNDDAAYAALAQMGNQVIAGASFAEVAKARSDGPTASKGGGWDWTVQGALVCKGIDKALFSLPVGQLSPIIQGPNGFHIVRVTSRSDETVAPFLNAQVEIREKIVKQRSDKQLHDYLAKLESHTPVVTIFDAKEKQEKESLANQPIEPDMLR
jgi:parvulin-like peptidyl-prolyl isomerase